MGIALRVERLSERVCLELLVVLVLWREGRVNKDFRGEVFGEEGPSLVVGEPMELGARNERLRLRKVEEVRRVLETLLIGVVGGI